MTKNSTFYLTEPLTALNCNMVFIKLYSYFVKKRAAYFCIGEVKYKIDLQINGWCKKAKFVVTNSEGLHRHYNTLFHVENFIRSQVGLDKMLDPIDVEIGKILKGLNSALQTSSHT